MSISSFYAQNKDGSFTKTDCKELGDLYGFKLVKHRPVGIEFENTQWIISEYSTGLIIGWFTSGKNMAYLPTNSGKLNMVEVKWDDMIRKMMGMISNSRLNEVMKNKIKVEEKVRDNKVLQTANLF